MLNTDKPVQGTVSLPVKKKRKKKGCSCGKKKGTS
jgi:hypothetical protein